MTKKDYLLIAQAIDLYPFIAPTKKEQELVNMAISYMVNRVADALQAENPRFDRQKFLVACGVESYEEYDKRHQKGLELKEVCKFCGGGNLKIGETCIC